MSAPILTTKLRVPPARAALFGRWIWGPSSAPKARNYTLYINGKKGE